MQRWQESLQTLINEPAELLELLGLSEQQVNLATGAETGFPLRLTRSYLQRIKPGDPNDPLLLQVLPTTAELAPQSGFCTDPVGDLDAQPVRGLLHKYAGRVLLVLTGACAIHCRYCFHRHFPYGEMATGQRYLRKAVDFIAEDPSLTEVILSGGDPLMLDDDYLADCAALLGAVPHVQRLRIHSRLPVVLPERIDSALLEWLSQSRLHCVVVIHVNHANEIDRDVKHALAALRSAGATLLNQAVLLRGINDSVAAQVALSNALLDAGVLPYYLHMLDPVQGAAHFDVDEVAARQLMDALRARLPGYLVPRLVREEAGMGGKTPVG